MNALLFLIFGSNLTIPTQSADPGYLWANEKQVFLSRSLPPSVQQLHPDKRVIDVPDGLSKPVGILYRQTVQHEWIIELGRTIYRRETTGSPWQQCRLPKGLDSGLYNIRTLASARSFLLRLRDPQTDRLLRCSDEMLECRLVQVSGRIVFVGNRAFVQDATGLYFIDVDGVKSQALTEAQRRTLVSKGWLSAVTAMLLAPISTGLLLFKDDAALVLSVSGDISKLDVSKFVLPEHHRVVVGDVTFMLDRREDELRILRVAPGATLVRSVKLPRERAPTILANERFVTVLAWDRRTEATDVFIALPNTALRFERILLPFVPALLESMILQDQILWAADWQGSVLAVDASTLEWKIFQPVLAVNPH